MIDVILRIVVVFVITINAIGFVIGAMNVWQAWRRIAQQEWPALETASKRFNNRNLHSPQDIVRLLRDECVTLDGRLQLIGIDELWSHRADIPAAFGACGDRNLPRVVLGHNPDLMAHITQNAELFLFGHTHGGQIYIPGLMKQIVPVEGALYRGEYRLPQGLVYVSNGCGETTTPTRFGTRVEVVAVTLYC